MKRESITTKIDPELNLRFRERILKTCGVQKGCLSKSLEEAIELYLAQPERPTKAIDSLEASERMSDKAASTQTETISRIKEPPSESKNSEKQV